MPFSWIHPSGILKEEEITPIYLAIFHLRFEELEFLLEQEKKHPSSGVKSSYTPLHYAAEVGDSEAAEILIDYGADVNARYVKQPLTELKQTNNGENNSSDLNELTPIQLAAMNEHYEVMIILLQSGAHMDNISQERRREIYLHSLIQKLDDFPELLRPHIDRLNEFNESGLGINLHVAPIRNRHRWLQQLLQQGVNPNIPGREGFTPLQLAAGSKDIVAMNILLFYGANPNAASFTDSIPLLSIAMHISINKELLRRRPKNLFKTGSVTEIVKTLLFYGSNPNSCNFKGYTVFDFASGDEVKLKCISEDVYVNEDALEWLLIYGSDWRKAKHNYIKDYRIRTSKVIVEYNVKRQIAGLKFQTEVLIDCQDILMEGFRERCLAEIKKMKTHYLFEKMTMYEFLRCSTKRSLVTLFREKEIHKVYMQASYKTEFPIYKNFIEYNFIEGEKYGPVYDSAFDNLNKLCGYRLPDVMLNEIMDYIDKKDMENLIKVHEKENNEF